LDFVEEHGGRIVVESAEGNSAVFVAEIPLETQLDAVSPSI
jgi:signal transduction histidine kinase